MNYVYQYKDHLGNVRLSYTDNDKDGKIDLENPNQDLDGDGIAGEYEIIEESNYYPFGLKHKGYNNVVSAHGNSTAQKFGYNGKELNEELGIQWHDFGARNYDAALGRWMNLDPLAEDMTSISPYAYAFNNPIYYFDEDGNIPLPSIVNFSRISSAFGIRQHPIHKVYKGHGGVDLAASKGSSVRAAARGKVVKVGWDAGGYGRYIVIKHADGYYSLYGHLEKSGTMVIKNQNIENGQLIATSGNTGGSTGPHLHFEIIKANSFKGVFNKSNKVDPQSIYDLDVMLHGVYGPQLESEKEESIFPSLPRPKRKCTGCTLHSEPVSPVLRPTVKPLPGLTPGGVSPLNPGTTPGGTIIPVDPGPNPKPKPLPLPTFKPVFKT